MTNQKITAADLVRALRAIYPPREWALLEQVAPGTGWNKQQRWLDVVCMSLWPSRGLEIHGIEVKVSRSDWRRELHDPSKADAVARFCHRFFIAAPIGVVPKAELPPAWGLLEITDGVVRAGKRAELREPEPVTAAFVAAVLRRASEAQAREVAAAESAALMAEAEKIAQSRADELARAAHADLVKQIAALETEVEGLQRKARVLGDLDIEHLLPWEIRAAIAEHTGRSAARSEREARAEIERVVQRMEQATARVRGLLSGRGDAE